MKARVKATGEIVEIIDIDFDTLFCKNGGHYTLEHLEGIECDPDYWTRLEHQYAGMAMQGLLNNRILAGESVKANNNGIKDMSEVITRAAVVYATALVEKLKEEQRHGTKAV